MGSNWKTVPGHKVKQVLGYLLCTGCKFLKAGNRNIYAVPQFKGKRKVKKQMYASDDDDDFEPPSKHVCHGSNAILTGIKESFFEI